MTNVKRVPLVSLRLVRERTLSYAAALSGPAAAAALAIDLLEDRDREHFVSIFLDTKHRPLGVEISSVGTANACLVSPGVVFRAALLTGAVAAVFAHNHPSGDTIPSPEDFELTRVLCDAGRLIGVRVLDHLVIGSDWQSIRELRPNLNWD